MAHPYKLGMQIITNTVETGEVVEIDDKGEPMIRVKYDNPTYRDGGDWFFSSGKGFGYTGDFPLTMEPKDS